MLLFKIQNVKLYLIYTTLYCIVVYVYFIFEPESKTTFKSKKHLIFKLL